MAQTKEVRGVATSIRPSALFQFIVDNEPRQIVDATVVRYHNTDVVAFSRLRGGRIAVVLNNGGYSTVTTKLRMNQAAHQYNLGFAVYQKDFEWYVVDDTDAVYEFNGRAVYLELEDGRITNIEKIERVY